MKDTVYNLTKSGDFVVEDYGRQKAFSSFFPGIAGLRGIPLWAFYVNRGQCISSFGVKDKDGAMLEFLPADQAYRLTAMKGFRTFIKIRKAGRTKFYEPFKESAAQAGRPGRDIHTRMLISPARLEIEEINDALGFKINVSYITVPGESFPALARKLTIRNISGNKADVEIIDGLPAIIPFGMTEWHSKHMSRTIEAWMRVLNADNRAPLYKLKVNPQDRPELEYIEGGNFYAAYLAGKKSSELLKAVIDPDAVFGMDGDISYPAAFADDEHFKFPVAQRAEGKTPSAFCHARFGVPAGGSKDIVSIIGRAEDVKNLKAILQKTSRPGFFAEKLSENEDIIKRLLKPVFTNSSSDRFNFYARHTFLDNALRGGFPAAIDTPKGKFIFYTYARKHGDLERDYNSFLLEPSYYSQGNGAYRDINQNRRNDPLLCPAVGAANILTFLNAIQPDGFNPHLVEGAALYPLDRKAAEAVLRGHVKNTSDRNRLTAFLLKGFTPGGLLLFVEGRNIALKKGKDRFLKEMLSASAKEDVIFPGEGYWIDHWTYNTDLLESYLACYPEMLEKLLTEKKFIFYDTFLKVNPRSEKYVYAQGKIRQFGSVVEDEEKKRLINRRERARHAVRTENGGGSVYKTSLLAKLLCVIANKMASLDPFGIGIEMEAGKPGWCDSLNNLPGVFGSSLCETFELKRLMLFLKRALAGMNGAGIDSRVPLPAEMADFIMRLQKLAAKNLSAHQSNESDFGYWDKSSSEKERYRDSVWRGFSGKEKSLPPGQIDAVLDIFLRKAEKGIEKGYSRKDGMTYTYYVNAVEKFEFIKKGGKTKVNADGLPGVRALSFKHMPLPLFLEGPVHAMRVMNNPGESRQLYRAVRKSALFDKRLKMYKINAPLAGMPDDIGRSTIFTPGWLENESVWLHMEYKYLLEVLRSGLHEEFFSDIKNCLVAFHDPRRYGRSVLENSSFIVSSAHPDRNLHGRGFVARLTGSTTEFLAMWLIMCAGERPFRISEGGELRLELKPVLPGWLFTKEESARDFYFPGGRKEEIIFPKDSFAFCFLGGTLVVYHNPKRQDTFGKNAVTPASIVLKKRNKAEIKIAGGIVPGGLAQKVRNLFYDRIDVFLSAFAEDSGC